jgi:type IV pilus assembly protein PilY1
MDLGGQPLYKTGASQPITSAPIPLTLPLTGTSDPKPGYMVVFGTGKFYEVSDITTTSTQSVYGVWDPVAFGAGTIPAGTALTNNSLLIQQTIGAAQVAPNGNTYFTISGNTVDYVGQTTPTVVLPRRGWWFNLPNTGQRLVYPLDSLQERYIIADTISPANVSLDPCANTTGGTGYLYIVDALNGGGPTEAILDTNADGNVDTSDLVVAGIQGKADGRNVALWVNSSPPSSGTLPETSKFVILSSDSGSIVGSLSCRLIDPARCQPPPEPPPHCVDPAGCEQRPPGPAAVRSRQWRQLFLR